MILQELTALYKRQRGNPEIDICEPGFSKENISFKIVIDKDGKFKFLEDLRVRNGKNIVPVKITVPKFDGKRANGIKPYFLWDKSDYTVGYAIKENKVTKELEVLKTPKHHEAFNKLLDEVTNSVGIHVNAIDAVKYFCTAETEIEKLSHEELWIEFLGTFAVFEVEGTGSTIFSIDSINAGWKKFYSSQSIGDVHLGICSILGEEKKLAGIHPTIKKGVGGKNDIPLVSCNIDSGESYGKKKGKNAQISAEAASFISGALNYLVDTHRHNIKIANTLTLFWAENNTAAEDIFGGLFDNNLEVDDGYSKILETFLKEVKKGVLPSELEDDSRFFVLGLSPNSARISVRFWYSDSIKQMGIKIGNHFKDLEIVPQSSKKDRKTPSMWQLLIETASQHKTENIPPTIAGPIMKSILTGSKYPSNILSILVGRIRVDQEYNKLNYYRASFIKAILNRNFNKELSMALDTGRTSIPYCLGRLFSVLEKTQEDSSGGNMNSTIKDRYFASASATPKIVFPLIIRLAQNHMKKLKSNKPGMAVNREKLIGEIMGRISDFPATLKLDEQGEFAIGYYHQRQNFFISKAEKTEGEN